VIATVEAPSLLEGINMLNLSANRQISLFHTKMLVFSEEYAREGVIRYLDPLSRFREVRESMRVVVCQGTAEEFIKESKAVVGKNISKELELSFFQASNTAYFPDVFFYKFHIAILSPYGQPVAIYAGVNDFEQESREPKTETAGLRTEQSIPPGSIPRTGGDKGEFFGTAVFDGDKMVGYLDQNETRFYQMVIGGFKWGLFTLPDKKSPGNIYVLEVKEVKKPQVKVTLREGKPIIDLKLAIEADISSMQSERKYEDIESFRELESETVAYFQEGIKKTITKSQREMNSDIFFFGKKAARNFRTIQEMEDYNWLKRYSEAEVKVEVDLNLRRTGFVFETKPVRSSSGSKGGNSK
jgi:spore germination protein KC